MGNVPQQFQPSADFGNQFMMAQASPTGYGQIPGGQIQSQPMGYPSQYQNEFQTGYNDQPSQMQYGSPGYQAQFSPGIQPGYNLQPQMQQPTGYQDVAQFDPYGPIAQGWGDGRAQPSAASPSSGTFNGNLHPREYIRKHKAELETWDQYAWKQALNTFDALKDAWAARRKEVEERIIQVQRDYGYTGQQEVQRLQDVKRQAGSNFGKLCSFCVLIVVVVVTLLSDGFIVSDSVTASSFQLHEVFQGYRQSADHASKRRVREATNAALSSLPDWPAQSY